MNVISIRYVKYKNFRSLQNEAIGFPTTSGLKFLTGENIQEPRLGANGAGKSSVMDGIHWCFYGTGMKGIKSSRLLTWGKTEMEVEVGLRINEADYTVRRVSPPNRTYINNEVCEQTAIDALLGLSRLRFVNAVLFGQDCALFPDYSIPDRGLLFDEVLNLDIWTKCSDKASFRHSELEKEIANTKSQLAYVDGQLYSLPTEESISKQIDDWQVAQNTKVFQLQTNSFNWEAEKQNAIASATLQRDGWEFQRDAKVKQLQNEEIAWIERKKQEGQTRVAQLEQLEIQHTALILPEIDPELENAIVALRREGLTIQNVLQAHATMYNDAVANIKLFSKKKVELQKEPICPTCKRPLPKADQTQAIVEIDVEISAYEITKAEFKTAVETVDKDYQKVLSAIADKERELLLSKEKQKQAKKEITQLEERMQTLEKDAHFLLIELENSPYKTMIAEQQSASNPWLRQIELKQAEQDPYLPQIEAASKEINPYMLLEQEVKDKRFILNAKKDTISKCLLGQEQELTAVQYWKQGFKKIRLYFVQQTLDALQLEIQSALSTLGLDDWEVKLSTEAETKSGTLKLGIQIHIKSPIAEAAWEEWSGGEKQRLRLAMAMGLASLIQRAGGVWFTWEIYDEPTSWLSPPGIEDLAEALRYRSEVQKKQIWIIDHRAIQSSSFSEIWTVQKTEEGSKVYKMFESEN